MECCSSRKCGKALGFIRGTLKEREFYSSIDTRYPSKKVFFCNWRCFQKTYPYAEVCQLGQPEPAEPLYVRDAKYNEKEGVWERKPVEQASDQPW